MTHCLDRPVMQVPFAINALGASHTIPGKYILSAQPRHCGGNEHCYALDDAVQHRCVAVCV